MAANVRRVSRTLRNLQVATLALLLSGVSGISLDADALGRKLLQQGAATAPVPAPAGSYTGQGNACKTTTYFIYVDALVNLTELECTDTGQSNNQNTPGRYGRGMPFGFDWIDTTADCRIDTVTVALQGGVSCTSTTGNTTLNGNLTSAVYNFPYTFDYNQTCTCYPPISPIQVVTFRPGASYCQGCRNTFSVLGSTGSNGLRPVAQLDDRQIYAAVVLNQWTPSQDIGTPRTAFEHVHLLDGTVLAVGGITTSGVATNDSAWLNNATGVWSPSNGTMQMPRFNFQVASLNNNPDSSGAYYAIAAGGSTGHNSVSATTDIYNSSSHTWTPAPSMVLPRTRFQLTSIFNNSNAVLASGGLQGQIGETTVVEETESYDLDSNTWRVVGNMTVPRYRHRAVLLNDGNVLAIGGQAGDSAPSLASVELFNISNPTDLQWQPKGNLSDGRYAFTATLLKNGSVLVVGGAHNRVTNVFTSDIVLGTCEIYDPRTGLWSRTGSLNDPRADHSAVLFEDGTVLVAGGGPIRAQAEIWNPRTGNWTRVAPMLTSRVEFGLARLDDNSAIAFGGAINGSLAQTLGMNTSEVYRPAVSLDSLQPTISPNVAPGPLSPVESPPVTVSTAGPVSAGTPVTVNPQSGSSKTSVGAIAGGVAGGVVGLAILAALATYFVLRRRRQQRDKEYDAPNPKEPVFAGAPLFNTQGTPLQGSTFGDPSFTRGMESTPARGPSKHRGVPQDHMKPMLPTGGPSPNSTGRTTSTAASTVGSSQRSIGIPGAAYGRTTAFAPSPATSKKNTASEKEEVAEKADSAELSADRIIPSPFADYTAFPNRNSHGAGGIIAEDEQQAGLTWDPETQTGPATGPAIGINRGLHHKLSSKGPRSVSGGSGSSLERLSVAIHKELQGAKWRIDRKAFTLGRRIGKGGFGEVFEGNWQGTDVAVKVLEIEDERTLLDACQEFGYLHSLRHSKLVQSFGACVEGNTMMLIMERMEEDLYHAIANDHTSARNSCLWNFRGWQIAVDIASALVYLHSEGLVHLDVKSLNILLTGKRREAKLSDLGLARMVPDGSLALQATLPGTPAYSAPEVVAAQQQWLLRTNNSKPLNTQITPAADIFAFGVVLFEIVLGESPMRWRSFSGTIGAEQAPQPIAELIDQCLQDEPIARPTSLEVLNILKANKPAHMRS